MIKLYSIDNDLYFQMMKVALVISIILAVVTFVWFIQNTFNLWSEQKNQVVSYQNIKTNKEDARLSQMNQDLAAQHLFGREDVTATNPNSGPEKLVGIILRPDGNRAIFASADIEDKIYKVGDRLVDGSVIYKIAADKVTLLRESLTKELKLDWESGNIGLAIPPISQIATPISSPEQYNPIHRFKHARFRSGD